MVWILFVLGDYARQWESGWVATAFFAVGHLYTSEIWFPPFFLSQQERPSSFPSSGEPSIIFLSLFVHSASALSLPWPLLPNLKHAWFCVCPIEQRDKLSIVLHSALPSSLRWVSLKESSAFISCPSPTQLLAVCPHQSQSYSWSL